MRPQPEGTTGQSQLVQAGECTHHHRTGILSITRILRQIAVFTLRFDWSFPGLDSLGRKSVDCMPGSADEDPFSDEANVTPRCPLLHGRLVAQASTVATVFRLRECRFWRRRSPQYDSPQSPF